MDHLKDHIQGSRKQYDKDSLSESDLTETPFELFGRWLQMALDENVPEPIAMNLATADATGRPSSRIVLLRGFDQNGFVFYTNYNSSKGNQMHDQPMVALNFYWQELHKQVRIEGHVIQIPESISDEYFNSRPRESQLGAWASAQSERLNSRLELEEKLALIEQKYKDQPVPRPPHWGGYQVIPNLFEFWQGRPDRLHDRFQYTLQNNSWQSNRLSP